MWSRSTLSVRPFQLAKDYTLRFHGPGGDYTVTGGGECDQELELRHGAMPIGPAIDADDAFFKAVDADLARG